MKKLVISIVAIVAIVGAFFAVKTFEKMKSGLPSLQQKSAPVASVNDNRKDNFSFAIIGDSRSFKSTAEDPLRVAVQNIQKSNPDFSFAMGDLVNGCNGGDSCDQKFQDWESVLGDLFPKTFEVQGNHDRVRSSADESWRKIFKLPENGPQDFKDITYSFDYGNSHLVVLASNNPSAHIVNLEQRDWLEKDLASNKKANTFVFFHEPAYPVGYKIGSALDAKEADRNALWSILDKYGVTAVFSGHEHFLSRRKIDSSVFSGAVHNIYQFVIGNTDVGETDGPRNGLADYSYVGHAYAIVRVEGAKITFEAYSVDGKLLDMFTF